MLHATALSGVSRAALVALVLLSTAQVLPAQTIRPVLTEHVNVAKGRIELVNPTTRPLKVVMNARSFTVSETGDIAYGPLDARIQLKLSAMSFQIGPQQSYYVFYEARSTRLPTWFVLFASMSGFAKHASGMNVRLSLPHTVYILPKHGATRGEVRVAQATFDASSRRIQVEVENEGESFGRVLSTEVTGSEFKMHSAGFPLYPGSKRKLEIAWMGAGRPERVTLRFKTFRVEALVTSAIAVEARTR